MAQIQLLHNLPLFLQSMFHPWSHYCCCPWSVQTSDSSKTLPLLRFVLYAFYHGCEILTENGNLFIHLFNCIISFTSNCKEKCDIYNPSRSMCSNRTHFTQSMHAIAYVHSLCCGNPCCLCQYAVDQAVSHMNANTNIPNQTQSLKSSCVCVTSNGQSNYWKNLSGL